MNKYDCSYKICDLTQKLKEALRGDEDEIIHDMYTFKSSLSRGSHSLSKKYNPTIVYAIGDVVGLDGLCYISLSNNNIGRNPKIDRGMWAYFLNPFEKNQGKVKAFCYYEGPNIIKSYNIQSLTLNLQNDNTRGYTYMFTFTLKQALLNVPCVITSIPQYTEFFPQIDDFATKPLCADVTNSKIHIIHNNGSVQRRQPFTQANSHLMNVNSIKGFFVAYENSETVPAK